VNRHHTAGIVAHHVIDACLPLGAAGPGQLARPCINDPSDLMQPSRVLSETVAARLLSLCRRLTGRHDVGRAAAEAPQA
jgi:hypothetical protein